MSDKSKETNIMKKTFIFAALVSAIYVAIQLLNVNSFLSAGVWLLLGPFMSTADTGTVLSIILSFAFQVLTLITPALIIGLFLAITKQPNPFRVALLSVLLTYLVSLILGFVLFYLPLLRFVIYFVGMFVAYFAAKAIVDRIRRPLPVWALISGLTVVSIVAAPIISNTIYRPVADKKHADMFATSLENLKFTAYYPTYIPNGLSATDAKFEGYQNLAFQHQHINYTIGKLEVRISEKLINQDGVFNKGDNCDISAVWFEMRSENEISPAKAESSRDNLAPCRILGKTKDGHEVYIEANKSQSEYYYMEVDGTIIVMQHDKLPRPRYASDFENEIMKIFNSMEELDSSKIKQFSK